MKLNLPIAHFISPLSLFLISILPFLANPIYSIIYSFVSSVPAFVLGNKPLGPKFLANLFKSLTESTVEYRTSNGKLSKINPSNIY